MPLGGALTSDTAPRPQSMEKDLMSCISLNHEHLRSVKHSQKNERQPTAGRPPGKGVPGEGRSSKAHRGPWGLSSKTARGQGLGRGRGRTGQRRGSTRHGSGAASQMARDAAKGLQISRSLDTDAVRRWRGPGATLSPRWVGTHGL